MKVNILVLLCVIACLTLVSAVAGATVADFTGSPTEGSAPLTVVFTDASENASSWSWDFGDDSDASPAQNPTHTYSVAGTYTVTLTAAQDNESDTETKSGYITVDEADILPTAGFTSSVTSGNIPLSVSFTDGSEHATSWSWDFGDYSDASTVQNPSHTYSTFGTFTVTQTATNPNGSTTSTASITVSNPLNANFVSSPTSGTAPLIVTFTDDSTPSAYIDTYSWTFGDGSTSSEQNPVHNFTEGDTYSVTLEVSNTTYGISDSYTGPIVVSSSITAAPVAAFSANVTSGAAPLAVLFTDESTGTVEYWTWEIYDGNDDEIESAYTENNFTYVFEDEGIYTIKLIASNGLGSNTTTKTDYITVGDVPSVSFTSTPTSGYAPLSVVFRDTSTGNITTRLWDFDDGTTSTSRNITHTFSEADTYTVLLSVSNGVGTVNKTKTITVLSSSATQTTTPVPTAAPTYAGTNYDADATDLTATELGAESTDDGGIIFHNPLTEEIWKFYSVYLEYMKYLKGTAGIT